MANLQQCLLQNSVQPSKHSRGRKKRNKGKKVITPLNNSIIQEFSWQRSVKDSNANNNTLFRFGIPGGSVVKPITEVSEVKPNTQKSADNQSFGKFPANQTIDLCSDDSSNETLVYNYNNDEPHSVISQQQNETLIDISEDAPDENEIIIIPDDEDKPPENQCSHISPHECKPLESKHPHMTPCENKPIDSVYIYVMPCENKPDSKYHYQQYHENKQPDTHSSNSESSNAKPDHSQLRESKCPCITFHENQTFDIQRSVTILSSPDSKPPNDKPSVSKCPCVTLHENNTHDTDSPNSKPPNVESPNNRPPKSLLLHSRPENQSPLHSPPEKKHCITPPHYEQTNAATKLPNNKPIERKDLCATSHECKQSKAAAKPANNTPDEMKHPCVTSPKYEQSNAVTKLVNSSPPIKNSQTVVIDISDDESEDDLNPTEKNDTNDEVLVIGTFNKTSKPKRCNEPNVGPPKKPSKKSNNKHIREQLMKLCNESPRDSPTEPPKEIPKPHPRDLQTERPEELPQPNLRDLPKEHPKENCTQGSSTTVPRQEAADSAESSSGSSNPNLVKLRRRIKAKYFRKLLQYRKKMEVDLFDTIKYQHLLINNTLSGTELASGIGGNVYINAPVYIPTTGLRPIMIDGSNVAFTSENQYKFSCKRLDICIKYFKEKGHKVTAFVPQFRVQSNQSDDPGLLDQLVRSGDVVLTPSKVIDGKLIVPYDDRFIVQAAVLKGGVIISRDNYKDLLEENPTWAETIKYRTLAYTWVDDVLMFPSDPLGGIGPSLDEFLRFD